ncbi:MAG TPA: carbohydrate-binding protein, partial [Flavisolibacter sp.]|nr:carbohydrate-binding protein [Flavisolibacter sp.]
ASSTTINAVDYDLGRNGVAYFDLDTADYHVSGIKGAGNKGRVYRNDGVDIRRDSATSNNYYVSDFEKGEWLQYTIRVVKKGNYTLKLQISSNQPGGQLSLQVNGKTTGQSITVPQTNSPADWQVQEIKQVPLNAGKQVLRIYADAGTVNLKSIEVSK